MNEKEQKKYKTIVEVIKGFKTKEEAATYLQLSKRQIDRLIIKYNQEGENGFIHKNKGKESDKKIDQKTRQEIVNLYIRDYYDYNFTHFYDDIVKDTFNISYTTLVNVLTEENIISPMAMSKTKREYNFQMKTLIKNKNITSEKKKLYESRKLNEEQAHTRKSNLFLEFGEELQMDAAEFMWFDEIVTYLHLVVDKATKMVLFGWFDYQETTRAYFVLLFNIVYLYGIPQLIKADKRKVFYNDKEDKFTQFGEICNTLGIKLDCNSNPRFKPNVERENYTFENRLKSELRHEKITNINDANKYLNEVFIPKMNAKFAIKTEKTKMRKNNYSVDELYLIISEREERKIDTGSCIKYGNKYYIPIDNDDNEVYFKNKTSAIVIKDYNNNLRCLIEQNYYNLKLIEKKEYTPAIAAREIVEEIKKKECKKYIPPANHPWRSYKI